MSFTKRHRLIAFLAVWYIQGSSGCLAQANEFFAWDSLPPLPSMTGQHNALGVAGPFVGVHQDALIVAGGANFEKPYWQSEKSWHSDIWVFEQRADGNRTWVRGGELPRALAYGASIATPLGLLCMGGNDATTSYDDVFLLQWDPVNRRVVRQELPRLPKRCTAGSAVLIDETVYLTGGTEGIALSSAMKSFWSLDLSRYQKPGFGWEVLPPWPGPERAYHITVAQHNGYQNCVYVISGRNAQGPAGTWNTLTDVYEFSPDRFAADKDAPWRQRTDIPFPRMAGSGISVGQSHIFVLSGDDGALHEVADSLRDEHPGFPQQILGYHTITDTWFLAGDMPQNQVTAPVVPWHDSYVMVSGEIKPRTRTPLVWSISTRKTAVNFGWINSTTIVIYLLLLVGMGVYFSYRNKNTEDFFRGGQRVPWWAAGCSIFATMLSSLTFMSVPAKSYATDWVYFFINMAIIALAPFIIRFILPFFRKIDATSAYQYIEMRFNLVARLFASAGYILFQVGRMAIVMYLPALALATVTPFSIEVCILTMGLLSIIYCTLGGVEAVIWTDTLQTFVLLSGALLSLLVVLLNTDGGISNFWTTAQQGQKFTMVDWSWDYTTATIWVVVVGGIGQQLIPYSSDQGVVQRYMSVSSEKNAARSIWANAWLSLFGTVLFFCVGTALYVFYKNNPAALDPTFQTDAVFPQFIARQLPVGVAGLVIAGVFAAAQSTISTSMNSMATAVTTDFVRRFNGLGTESAYFRLARFLTVLFGVIGTAVALLIAYADIKSLWDSFLSILGLFGSAICGLFMLGMFTQKANSSGALVGVLTGVIVLWWVQQYTDASFLLYGAIGISVSVVIGYLASLVIPSKERDITGLTIYN